MPSGFAAPHSEISSDELNRTVFLDNDSLGIGASTVAFSREENGDVIENCAGASKNPEADERQNGRDGGYSSFH